MEGSILQRKESLQGNGSYLFSGDYLKNPVNRKEYSGIFNFDRPDEENSPFSIEPQFISAGWKTIILPVDFLHCVTSLDGSIWDYDYKFSSLNCHWLQVIIEFFQPDRAGEILLLNGGSGGFARCRSDGELVREVYMEEFYPWSDTFMTSQSLHWGAMSTIDQVMYLGAEAGLMAEFEASFETENLLEYFSALVMNSSRWEYLPETMQQVYAASDWEMPFEMTDDERGLRDPKDAKPLVRKTRLELCERFRIDPSMLPDERD
jgi:hypothetical protein